ncbi:MAG TPA: helix-turn-helix domain-containing protein [Phycisphaerae bacterium]|nr:helix-turn-helix domain-containing protein [Phycisphaerae bacterium]
MTPDAYRKIRRKLGLTQAGLAARLGVTSTTVARRERGEQRITREAELAIRQVVAQASRP